MSGKRGSSRESNLPGDDVFDDVVLSEIRLMRNDMIAGFALLNQALRRLKEQIARGDNKAK